MKTFSELLVATLCVALLHEPSAHWLYEGTVVLAFPAAACGALCRVYFEDTFRVVRASCFGFLRQHTYQFLQTYCVCAALLKYVPWSMRFFTLHLGVSWWIFETFNSCLAGLNSPMLFPLMVVLVVVGGPSLMATWLIWSFWLYFAFGWVQFVVLGGSFALLTGAFPAHRVFRVLDRPKEKLANAAPPEGEEKCPPLSADDAANGLGFTSHRASDIARDRKER